MWATITTPFQSNTQTITNHPLYSDDKHFLGPSQICHPCSFSHKITACVKTSDWHGLRPGEGKNTHFECISPNSECVLLPFENHITFEEIFKKEKKIKSICVWNIPQHAWVHLWEQNWEKLFTNRSIHLQVPNLGCCRIVLHNLLLIEERASVDSETVYEVLQ